MSNVDDAAPIYLDNAATSFPKPPAVYDAVDQYLRKNGAAIGRGVHANVDAAGKMIDQCRSRVARLIGAPAADRIAFTFNCTDSLNLLLRGILNEGDHVVSSLLEHNSVLRPLSDLAGERSVSVDYMKFDPATGLVNVKDLETLLSSTATRLVVLSHASNVLGTVQPVSDLAEVAHQHGALFLLDAAQTVGHLPLNCSHLPVDFLAAAGHKGALGPLGTGIVYVADQQERHLRNVRSGGTGTVSESVAQPTQMPARLESGNMNAPGLAGLNAGVQWLLEQSVEAIHANITRQTRQLAAQLSDVDSVRVFGHDVEQPNVGIVSFQIERAAAADVAVILGQSFGIQCRAGLHCAPLCHQHLQTANAEGAGGTVRLSPGPFTTDQHIATAVEAVQQIADAF